MIVQGFNPWSFFLRLLPCPLETTVTLLFLVLIQAWECTPGKELAWNILSLFTTSGMLFLEVSLIAFLLQGNYVGGLEDLTRPFGLSSLIVGLDLLLKVFLCSWKHLSVLLVVAFFWHCEGCYHQSGKRCLILLFNVLHWQWIQIILVPYFKTVKQMQTPTPISSLKCLQNILVWAVLLI